MNSKFFYFVWFIIMLFIPFFYYISILFHLNDYVVILEWELFSMHSVDIFYVLMFDLFW